MAKYFLLLLSSACFLLPAIAQEEKIDTDRPDQTESPFTVPRHFIQAEFGFNKENLSGRDYDLVHPVALLKYGLQKFEFRLEARFHSLYQQFIPQPKWTTGFDPVSIGFKAALWEEKKGLPKTSFIGGISLHRIATKAFRADHPAPAFRFTMQNSLAPHFALSYNLGAEWDGFSSNPDWIYTIAPGFDLGEKWYGYLEAFGFIRKNEKPQHNLDAGIAYYISRNVKIDLSGGVGISEAALRNYVAIGFSFRCPTQ